MENGKGEVSVGNIYTYRILRGCRYRAGNRGKEGLIGMTEIVDAGIYALIARSGIEVFKGQLPVAEGVIAFIGVCYGFKQRGIAGIGGAEIAYSGNIVKIGKAQHLFVGIKLQHGQPAAGLILHYAVLGNGRVALRLISGGKGRLIRRKAVDKLSLSRKFAFYAADSAAFRYSEGSHFKRGGIIGGGSVFRRGREGRTARGFDWVYNAHTAAERRYERRAQAHDRKKTEKGVFFHRGLLCLFFAVLLCGCR